MLSHEQSTLTNTARWLMVAAVVVGAALRLGMLVKPLEAIDNSALPDDTYYTLSIARSLANGSGPSVDGRILTNGFQPLQAFQLVPMFWLGLDGDQAVYAAVTISALWGVVSIVLIGWLTARLLHPLAGAVAALGWSVNPLVLQNDLNGLETSQAVTLVLVFFAACHWVVTTRSTAAVVGAGIAAGLALLARVDTCFAIALGGLVLLRHVGPKRVGLVALLAVAVVSPWWIYSLLQFGTVVPESGAAVRLITDYHSEIYGSPTLYLSWAVTTLASYILALPPEWKDAMADQPIVVSAVAALSILVAVLVVRASRTQGRDICIALCLYVGGLLAFYALYLPATWFFARYLYGFAIFSALAYGWSVQQAATATHPWIAPWRKVLLVGLGILVLHQFGTSVSMVVANAKSSVDIGRHGAKGYREAALFLLQHVPDGARLGALQSGALGYYAGDRVQVINLDGVVNRDAHMALRDHQLWRYIDQEKITYLADWQFNLDMMIAHSEPLRVPLLKIADGPKQGEDFFTLYLIPRKRPN